MKQVNLYEAKTTLSALVEEAAAGEDIIIAKNGKARARLTALSHAQERPAPRFDFWDHLGWKLPDNFNIPTPRSRPFSMGKASPTASCEGLSVRYQRPAAGGNGQCALQAEPSGLAVPEPAIHQSGLRH
jgi:antitoxin (DNA-binding transcriptional repressor) of toxin-antitoxin stability system